MTKQWLLMILIFLLLTGIVYFFQRNYMYFPSKEVPRRESFQANDMQVVAIETKDGLILHSWYKPAAPGQPTILYLHGNAGHIGYRMPLAREFISAGFAILLLEYRGFAGNKGMPSEKGLYLDGEAGLLFLEQQGISPEKIVLYGESLGTGVATYLAQRASVCALILQSPYTTMRNLARYHYPWILIPPWDKYDSLGRIATIKTPLLILHGEQDRIVPYKQALLLYQHANEPKKLIGFPAHGHNDLWTLDFSRKVIDFIRTYCS
jgi:fermentation-respiration switch protein FrsA (DUF1100 family)